MLNEVLQWAIILSLAFLLLGVLRHLSLTLPTRQGATIGSGPPVGGRLPQRLVSQLSKAIPAHWTDGGFLVAFITENCVACQRLLATLRSPEVNSSKPDGGVVLVVRRPSRTFHNALLELDVPVVLDEDDALWTACKITNTPLVVRVNSNGEIVAKGVTHNVDSVVA
jgi:hypothetical protein